MRIKYVKTADLSELEATTNLLLLEGWARDSQLQFLPTGEFLMTFVQRHLDTDRRDRMYGETAPGRILEPSPPSGRPPEPYSASGVELASEVPLIYHTPDNRACTWEAY